MIEYTADNSHVWGGDIDPDVLAKVDPLSAGGFERMMRVEKKWNLPGGARDDWPKLTDRVPVFNGILRTARVIC